MKLSLSSWSFYPLTSKGEMDVVEVVDKAKELGFSAVEIVDASFLPIEDLEEQKKIARKIRARADELGMPINCYAIGAVLYYDNDEDSAREVERVKGQLDLAKILGCSVMRHDCLYGIPKESKARSFDLMLPTIAKNIREITEYGEKLGIKTCVENHGYEVNYSDRLERLFNAVNHPNFGLLVDFGNFSVVDEPNVPAVARLAPYAIHVHAKDMLISAEEKEGFNPTRNLNYFQGTPVGTGTIDIVRCLKIMKRAKYEGYLTIEYEGKGDIIEGIVKSHSYLANALTELEVFEK